MYNELTLFDTAIELSLIQELVHDSRGWVSALEGHDRRAFLTARDYVVGRPDHRARARRNAKRKEQRDSGSY